MKVALFGPSTVSELDIQEINQYVELLVRQNYEIFVLIYGSIEKVVFKKFIELSNMDNFSNLNIFSAKKFSLLDKKTQQYIQFFVRYGSKYSSFDYEEHNFKKRSSFIFMWNDILKKCDGVTVFYDGEKSNLLIPIDEALKLNKKISISNLSREDNVHFSLDWKEKIRTN